MTPPLPLFPPNAAPVLPSLLTSAALGYSSSQNKDPNLCIVDGKGKGEGTSLYVPNKNGEFSPYHF